MHQYVGRLRWILASTLLVALIAGCGGGASGGTATGSGASGAAVSSIDVTMSEWTVKPSATKAKAGDVTFNVANKGATVHEFAIARTELPADKLPQAAGAVDEKQVPLVGRTANIDAGKTETKAFNLQAGKYVLFCNIPAHYGQGMHVALTVE
jgi:uncharacterized cupredoxin-like copper-binding protein